MKTKTSFGKFAAAWDKQIGPEGKGIRTIQIALPIMFKMFGSLRGKTVYDIATGNGFLARLMRKRGAKKVVASDVAPELITLAKEKYSDSNIDYQVSDATDFTAFPQNHFDLIVINQAIFYLQNLDKFFKGAHRVLRPSGVIVFNTFHPLFPLFRKSVGADLVSGKPLDPDKEAKKYPTSYIETIYNGNSRRKNNIKFNQYKRPISVYLNTLAKHGFKLEALAEPPSATMVKGKVKPALSPLPS